MASPEAFVAFRAAVFSLLPDDGACPPDLFDGLDEAGVQTVAGAGIAMTANLVRSLAHVWDADAGDVWRMLLQEHEGTGGVLDVTR